MRRVVVTEPLRWTVSCRARSPDEDTRGGGFTHGGWAMPNNDEVLGRMLGGVGVDHAGADRHPEDHPRRRD